jgi:hypothetical protein
LSPLSASCNPLPQNQVILSHQSEFALDRSRPVLQTRKWGVISLKIAEISGKKFDVCRSLLRIPPESIRVSGHLEEYEKKKGKGHNLLKSGDPG